MYRDVAIDLDEHDRAVGAILIAEALREECDLAWARSRDLDNTSPRQRWRAIAEIHDIVPEIWRHLDRARKVLAQRGANTTGYDELRPNAQQTASNPTIEGERVLDVEAIDDAKRGLAELKLAAAGADWAAIETRTQGLVRIPMRRKQRQRLGLAGGAAAIVFAASAWLFAIVPAHAARIKPASMASELRVVTEQRKLKIDMLIASLGDHCTPGDAHELMKQLVLDGRNDDARTFATGYLARCGEDPVVVHWAKAPKAKHELAAASVVR